MNEVMKYTGFFISKLRASGFPRETHEDCLQDIMAYCISREKDYDSRYVRGTWYNLMFNNWLAERARVYNAEKRSGEEVDLTDEGWGVVMNHQTAPQASSEIQVLCQRIWDAASPLARDYLLFKATGTKSTRQTRTSGSEVRDENPVHKQALLEGKSRQAMESRVKLEIEALRNTFGGIPT